VTSTAYSQAATLEKALTAWQARHRATEPEDKPDPDVPDEPDGWDGLDGDPPASCGEHDGE
jgi:hypothetical protein